MAINLRPPAQSIGSADEKLKSLYSYLFQLTEELNQALASVESSGRDTLYRAVSGGKGKTGKVPQSTTEAYQQLKSLIIKTATEVTAHMRTIVTEMSADYLAQSEYGTYYEYLNNRITQSAEGYVLEWDAEQGISTGVADFSEYKANSDVYMKIGIVAYNDDGTVEAGVVVGRDLQKVTIDGEEILISENVYSLLKADGLSLWKNGAKLTEVSLMGFFGEKAYIDEVTTELIQSEDKGAQLALNNGLLAGIAEHIDLTANESISLAVQDEVSKATVELDDKISLVVAGTDAEGKVIITEDAVAAIADKVDFSANESITLLVEDEVGKATVELDDKISLVVAGTDSEGKVVLTEDALTAISDEIVLTTAKELESESGTVIINDEGVEMTGGRIMLSSGSGSAVMINNERVTLSGTNTDGSASNVRIAGDGINMVGSEINMQSGGDSTVRISDEGIAMTGSAIDIATQDGGKVLIDEFGVAMTGGLMSFSTASGDGRIYISNEYIAVSGAEIIVTTADGNEIKINKDGIALTGGRISLDTKGTDNLIRLTTSDGGTVQIDNNGVAMTGGKISMATSDGGTVQIDNNGVAMTGGKISMTTSDGGIVTIDKNGVALTGGTIDLSGGTFKVGIVGGGYLKMDAYGQEMTGGKISMATNDGGSVLIDQGGVELTGGHIALNSNTELSVNAGKFGVSTGDFSLSLVKDDGNEVVMDIGEDGYTTLKGIHAGNVREAVYDDLYHTTESLGSLNGLASLLIATDARYVAYNMSKDEYGTVTFDRYNGRVWINAQGHRLPTINITPNFSGQITIENGILTGTDALPAISAGNGRIFLYGCWFAGGTAMGIYANFNADVCWVNASPTAPTSIMLSTYFIWVQNGGTIRYNGYIPGGEIWNWNSVGFVTAGEYITVLAPDSGTGGDAVDTTQYATLAGDLRWFCDKQSGGTGSMYQGYTSGKGICYGCMKFAVPSGVTIISATLTLTRVKGVGRGGEVEANLYSSTTAWGSKPTGLVARTTGATAPAWSQKGDIEATAAAQALANGAKQLVLYQADEDDLLSGKVYSLNYAQFSEATLNIAYR